MRFLIPAFAIVILITVYAGAATTPVTLVRIDSKDFGDTNSLIQIEELERDANTSKLRMTHQKMGSSVGSSMFIVRGIYEVAKARGAEYFINLKEWDDKEGGRIYVTGFTNTKDADLKQEFGAEYDYNNESGQKRGYMSVSQLKGMFESPAGKPVPSVKTEPPIISDKKDANEPDVGSSADTIPHTATPSALSMRELGAQAGHGDIGAIDKIEEIRNQLYQDIDYQKDHKRATSNLALMRAAFDEIARSVKGSDAADPAFRSLLYATGKNSLVSFTADAFGKAAAMGHKPSLDVLLHHSEHGILLSTAVFGLTMPAEKGNEQAITFLAAVIDNDSKKPLWYAASKGLVMAANQGNPVAQRAMSKFSDHGQGKSQQASQPNIKYSLSDRIAIWAKSLQPISGMITAISILLNLVFLPISLLLGYLLFRKQIRLSSLSILRHPWLTASLVLAVNTLLLVWSTGDFDRHLSIERIREYFIGFPFFLLILLPTAILYILLPRLSKKKITLVNEIAVVVILTAFVVTMALCAITVYNISRFETFCAFFYFLGIGVQIVLLALLAFINSRTGNA